MSVYILGYMYLYFGFLIGYIHLEWTMWTAIDPKLAWDCANLLSCSFHNM